MKPVFQRIICNKRGDCETAAVASILELPYEEVPCWGAEAYDKGEPHSWYGIRRDWLASRGLVILDVKWDSLNDWRGILGVHALASMPSQRFKDTWHSVVCTWERIGEGSARRMIIAHDPNPNNAQYPEGTTPRHISFLIPLRYEIRVPDSRP